VESEEHSTWLVCEATPILVETHHSEGGVSPCILTLTATCKWIFLNACL